MLTDAIRIGGAGLSGLSAAICLARRGHRVVVFEKSDDSGMGRHSDWDAIENWSTEADMLVLLREWGIEPSFAHRSTLSFEAYDNNGKRYPITTARPLFYLLKRGPEPGSVEQELKRQALDHGVTICYGKACARQDVDIWAAGSQHGGFFLGAGMTFRTQHRDTVLVLVSTEAAPKAYSYLVIVDGMGTLSVVLTRDFKQARGYLERSIAIFRDAAQFEMEDIRMTSGFGGLASAFWRPATRPIVVGEAAGFQDFLWGFGIRYALFSGYLAARAIDEGCDYEDLVSREVRPLVRSSMVNRTIYDLVGDRVYRALLRRVSTASNVTVLVRHWYRDLPFRYLVWPIAKRRYRTLKERTERNSAALLDGSPES